MFMSLVSAEFTLCVTILWNEKKTRFLYTRNNLFTSDISNGYF